MEVVFLTQTYNLADLTRILAVGEENHTLLGQASDSFLS